jgi:hypothetical protein
MDTQYIDLVSLDGNRSVIFNYTDSMGTGNGTISITANDVFVKGVDVQLKNFTIATNLNLLRVENCRGGEFSFGGDTTYGSNPIIVSGTFIDCDYTVNSGGFMFGGGGFASGTFINCSGNAGSFGSRSTGEASGVFENCKCYGGGFGQEGTASGTFINCVAINTSMGAFGVIASGTFINCRIEGGSGGFGTGSYTDPSTGEQVGSDASGVFINCISGDYSFGQQGTASGTFINCTGGAYSFGENIASGTFTNCIAGGQSFGASSGNTASGTFMNCTAGDQSFGYQGTASGTFTNCTGGSGAFGGDGGTLSGKLFYCRLTSGMFTTVSGAGITRLCLDGSNVENNQG